MPPARATPSFQAIVDDVVAGGTKSLIAQAVRLGDIKCETEALTIGPAEMKAAFEALPKADQEVLMRCKVRNPMFQFGSIRKC